MKKSKKDNCFEKIHTFVKRLKKLGIDVTISNNYPWIYLYKINGIFVKETYLGDHGFTIAFLPIDPKKDLKFNDISHIFKLIRKYI